MSLSITNLSDDDARSDLRRSFRDFSPPFSSAAKRTLGVDIPAIMGSISVSDDVRIPLWLDCDPGKFSLFLLYLAGCVNALAN